MHCFSAFEPAVLSGTNSVKRRPTVVDGKIEARPIMCARPLKPSQCPSPLTALTGVPKQGVKGSVQLLVGLLVGQKIHVHVSCCSQKCRYTALNYDHRLIDGREAVTFLCSVRDKLEDWGDFFYCDDLIHFSTEAFSGSISNAAGSLIHWISNAAPRKRTYEIHPGSNSWS